MIYYNMFRRNKNCIPRDTISSERNRAIFLPACLHESFGATYSLIRIFITAVLKFAHKRKRALHHAV